MSDERHGGGYATGSFVLGVIGMVSWMFYLVGLPVPLVGLVLGIRGLKSARRRLAMAGIVLCVIGLLLSAINIAIGLYQGEQGPEPGGPRIRPAPLTAGY